MDRALASFSRPLFALFLASAVACGTPADETPDAGGDSSPDGGGDTTPDAGDTTPEEPVTTATITFDGSTSTVATSVRRGLVFQPPAATKTISDTYGRSHAFSCSPALDVAQGGRSIIVDSVSISGNLTGNCAQNLNQVSGAEDNLKRLAGQACNGKATCTYDPTESIDTYMVGCNPQTMTYTFQYRCAALDPAPVFLLEATDPAIIVNAMDSAGSASCADRNARFFLGGNAVALAPDTACTIELTERTDRAIAGTITATLAGDSPRPLSITFRHNRNVLRPVAGLHLGNDVCSTNSITHTTRTVDGETWDDFATGALACQVTNPSPAPSFTFSRRRANAASSKPQSVECNGGRFDLAMGNGNTTAHAQGGCSRSFAVTETDEVLRLVAHSVQLCGDGGCESKPVAYLSIGLGDAAAPVP